MKEINPFIINLEMVKWGIITSVLIFVLVIALTRLFGLRSFARLSTFDFAFTLAKGALIASIAISDRVGFFEGAISLIVIYLAEWITSHLRNRYPWFTKLVNNKSILLVRNGQYIESNMLKAGVSREDIYFAMRQSDIQDMGAIRAIIAEPTGQISILTGSPDTVEQLLADVDH